MSIPLRLKEFLRYIQISEDKFTDRVNLSRGFVSKPRDSIRKKSLDKIKEVYPELNTDWLITGKEDMLIENSKVLSINKNIKSQNDETIEVLQRYLDELRALELKDDKADAVIDYLDKTLRHKKISK